MLFAFLCVKKYFRRQAPETCTHESGQSRICGTELEQYKPENEEHRSIRVGHCNYCEHDVRIFISDFLTFANR